jgi:hypothetical protein
LASGVAIVSYGFAKTEVHEEPEEAEGAPRGLGLMYWPKIYRGEVLEYHDAGVGLAKGPAYTHSAKTLNGISGGPVLCARDGRVHAIQCSGTTDYGVATAIRAFFDSWQVAALGHRTLSDYATLQGNVDAK